MELNYHRALQVFVLLATIPALISLANNELLEYLWISVIIYSVQQFFGFNAFMHRYVSHRAYKTTPFMINLMGLLSVNTMVGSPVSWAYIHRAHHKYENTKKDPHCPNHMGTLKAFFCLFYFDEKRQKESRVSIKDVVKDKELAFFNEHWIFLSFVPQFTVAFSFGLNVYAILFLIPMFLHTVVIYYFLITHVHRTGYKTYDGTTATNSKLMNIVSLGEGFHNNHHANPGRANTSFKDFDLVFWFIEKIRIKK